MKKYISGIVAVVLAIAALAFTTPNENAKRAGSWFTYDAINTPPQNQASSYTFEGSHTTCPDDQRLCAIHIANDNDGVLQQSELDALLQQENPGNSNPTNFPSESENIDFRSN